MQLLISGRNNLGPILSHVRDTAGFFLKVKTFIPLLFY